MPNFKLYVAKDGKLLKINSITDQILDLQRIDNITRAYVNETAAINDFKKKGYIDYDTDGGKLVITYNQDGQALPLDPLFKELYHTRETGTIYDQILEFAKDMQDAYDKCTVYAGKDTRSYFDKINARFKKYRWLTKPNFIDFVRERFTESKSNCFADVEITEEMEAQKETDPRMKFYIEKIKQDRIYLNFIDRFKNDALDENGYIIPNKDDIPELLTDYYNALLIGFHRLFVTRSGNFNYSKFRVFYKKYYDHFIGPKLVVEEKPSKVAFRTIQTDSGYKYVLENNQSPVLRPRPIKNNMSIENVSRGISHYTIEEAHLLNDEYFPDEQKMNNICDSHLAYNEDGTFVDKEDEAYKHIR